MSICIVVEKYDSFFPFQFRNLNVSLKEEKVSSQMEISLEDIRKYYFEKARKTLRIEDAKYLLERAVELGISNSNGGVQALFKTLKYHFEEVPDA